MDWGKLLDGREVLESKEGLQGRVREEGEQEGVEEDNYEEAASMFLKPNPKYLPSPKHPQEKHADTRYCDGAESRKTVHNHMESHAHHSSRRAGALQISDGRLLESTHSDESVRVGVRKSGSAATTSQCSRQSIEEQYTECVWGE